MKLKIALAGATGWMGTSLAAAIHASSDLELVTAIALEHVQQNLGKVINTDGLNVIITSDIAESLCESPAQVFIDFTTPTSVKKNVLQALSQGLHVVIGTSGLTDEDYNEIHTEARRKNVGVIAAGNFSLTAALMKHFSTVAARCIPEWEIIDYASARKPDAPSGTARELAKALSNIRQPIIQIPVNKTVGVSETRGGDMNGMRVHSIRLPGYTLSTEVIFGMPEEQLVIRHNAGNSPIPYIQGVLLAVRSVSSTVGLTRGLDSLLKL